MLVALDGQTLETSLVQGAVADGVLGDVQRIAWVWAIQRKKEQSSPWLFGQTMKCQWFPMRHQASSRVGWRLAASRMTLVRARKSLGVRSILKWEAERLMTW